MALQTLNRLRARPSGDQKIHSTTSGKSLATFQIVRPVSVSRREVLRVVTVTSRAMSGLKRSPRLAPSRGSSSSFPESRSRTMTVLTKVQARWRPSRESVHVVANSRLRRVSWKMRRSARVSQTSSPSAPLMANREPSSETEMSEHMRQACCQSTRFRLKSCRTARSSPLMNATAGPSPTSLGLGRGSARRWRRGSQLACTTRTDRRPSQRAQRRVRSRTGTPPTTTEASLACGQAAPATRSGRMQLSIPAAKIRCPSREKASRGQPDG